MNDVSLNDKFRIIFTKQSDGKQEWYTAHLEILFIAPDEWRHTRILANGDTTLKARRNLEQIIFDLFRGVTHAIVRDLTD